MDAYAKSKTPKEARDKRGTPPHLVSYIEHILGLNFVVDVCAEQSTNQGSIEYWTEEDDALKKNWSRNYRAFATFATSGLAAFWMNPPYSNPSAWCKKALEEVRTGMVVVGLLPDDRSTDWYQTYVKPHAAAIYFTDIRLPFLDEEGIPQYGNPKGSIIVVWAPWGRGAKEEILFIPPAIKQIWRQMRRHHDHTGADQISGSGDSEVNGDPAPPGE